MYLVIGKARHVHANPAEYSVVYSSLKPTVCWDTGNIIPENTLWIRSEDDFDSKFKKTESKSDGDVKRVFDLMILNELLNIL